MSPLRLPRPAIRALSLTAISVLLLSISLAWATRQQAGSPSFKSAGNHSSSVLFAGNGAVILAGATIIVNSLSDVANASDGLCTLREAITAANNNAASGAGAGECVAGSSSDPDMIDATGVNGTINLTAELPNITSNISMTGPGSSQLTVRRDTGGDYRIFTITGVGVFTLSGLTVSNGKAVDGSQGFFGQNGGVGGGIQNSGTLTLNDVTVTGNVGGIGGTSTGSDGGRGGDGGGIYSVGSITITNSSITNNTAGRGGVGAFRPGDGGRGGGIMFFPSFSASNPKTLIITNCIISGNTAGRGGDDSPTPGGNGGSGGGVYIVNSGATITNATISNNVAGDSVSHAAGGNGGGVAVFGGGLVTVTSSTISSNRSAGNLAGFGDPGQGGGIYVDSSGNFFLSRSTVSNNTTNFFGGGILQAGVAGIENSTVSGNTAPSNSGGGIYSSGTTRITSSTVTNNTAGTGFVNSGAQPIVRNTIIAANGAADVSGVFNSQGHNLIGQSSGNGFTNGSNGDHIGTSGSPLNPQLGALANNGGPTMTHALLASSPALDAGDDCVADVAHCGDANISQLTTDQRGTGFSRKLDGPDVDAISTVDIGAFEADVFVDDITDKSTNKNTQLQFSFNVGGAISSVTASSSNPTLVPNNNANLSVSGSGSTRTLTINPATDQTGTATITVTVTGTSGGSMTDTFVLTVNAAAGTPSVSNATTNEDVQSTAGLVISRNPADGAEVTHFKISNITNGALFKNNGVTSINNGDFITFSEGNAGLKFTPAPNLNSVSSSFSFQVQAATSSSGGGLSAGAATAGITVNAVNDAPSFTKGSDRTVNEDAGAQTVPNWATSISSGPVDESGQVITFTVTNDNNALFSSQPAVGANGTLSFTPKADANGIANVTVAAKDDGGTANGGVDTSTSQSFTITVKAVNDAPSFTKGADQTVNNQAGAQSVTGWATNISAGPSNESSQTVTFQVTGNTNPGLFITGPAVSSNGTLTYTPSASGGGTATITLVAKDNGGTANGDVDTSAPQSFTITVTPAGGFVSFASGTASTTENSGSTTVNVVRTGDTTMPVTVNYATNADAGVPCSTANGVASPKCDFTAALGTLSFAIGETSKPVTILISQDSFVEGPETITLTLSSPTGEAALGTPATMAVTIADDATEPPTNIIDDANTFVRMHYHDFLNREADQDGLNFWTGQMTNCGNSDLTVCRVNVSGAFFLSIEFQQTGYLVERIYKTGYGDATGTSQIGGSHQIFVPVVRANEFLADTQRVGRGVVVNTPGWETALENNKRAYALEFVQTSRFITAFPTTMTPAQFVDKLNTNAGGVLSVSERQTVINLFGNSVDTTNTTARAQALRQVAEDADLQSAEFNRAFVLSQFIGYLRRNPNDAPDSDYTGYDFWLGKLIQFNGNYVAAEMVKAFISSPEYRQRFGP